MRGSLLMLFLFAPAAMAQEPPPGAFVDSAILRETAEPSSPWADRIETDRDSFTPSTGTVSPGRAILETSYSFLESRGAKNLHSFPELLLRVGLHERLELRLGWNYEVGPGFELPEDEAGGLALESESRLLLGFKVLATEQKEWLPQSSFLVQSYLPTHGIEDGEWVFGYVFGWELLGEVELDAALRYATDREGDDLFGEWAPSIVLKVPVGDRFNLHAEWFSLYSQGKNEEFDRGFFSPGVHCLISPDLEVGLRVGWGLTDDAPNFFANVGVGVRF